MLFPLLRSSYLITPSYIFWLESSHEWYGVYTLACAHRHTHLHTHTHTHIHAHSLTHTCTVKATTRYNSFCHFWQKGLKSLSPPLLPRLLKHLSPDPAIFPWCNATMGGAKLMIAKRVAWHVNKHRPDSWKEKTLSLLTDQGMGYCCILLPQIRP